MKQKIIISLTAIILLFMIGVPAYAQSPNPITATVDRTSLSTGESLNLTVTVTADMMSMPQPMLPSLAGFNVLGTGTSSQINMINGAISAQTVYNYQLQPAQPGELTIDPVSVTVDGQTYNTPPITIQVGQGNGVMPLQSAPSANQAAPTAPTSSGFHGQDVYAEAEVSNPTPYLGEQVTYTFRLYQVANMFDLLNQSYFNPPAFTGFWSEGQPQQNQYRVQAGGAIYNVTEMTTVLFPSKTGQITIEPAQVTVPGGFFNRSQQAQSEPITVEVKPLPPTAPAGFTGAVGQFSLSSNVDNPHTKVNEPVTWQITLNGTGNLKTLSEPTWPEMPDWRSYDSQASLDSAVQNGQLGGQAVYKRLMVPLKAGQYTLPALEYAYFDPTTGQYQTLTSTPILVTVAPGDGSAAAQSSGNPAAAIAAAPIIAAAEPVVADIRHLKPVQAELSYGGQPVTQSPLYWLAWGVPFIGLVGHFSWKRRDQYWHNNPSLARSSQAGKKARQALAQARRSKLDRYSAASQILTDYLADKIDQPVVGLTQPALAQLLTAHNLPIDLIGRVQDCLTASELGRYAPGADQPGHAENLLKELDTLIRDLEKAL